MEYRYKDRIYNSETGKFHWALDIEDKIGRKTPGKEIGCTNSQGYIQVYIDGRLRMASRVAWWLVHGEWPKGQIDHINRIPTDNRIENLRVVTQRVNARNKSNNQKFPGVRKQRNRFSARIIINKKEIYLGSFKTEQEAIEAYQVEFDKINAIEQMG